MPEFENDERRQAYIDGVLSERDHAAEQVDKAKAAKDTAVQAAQQARLDECERELARVGAAAVPDKAEARA